MSSQTTYTSTELGPEQNDAFERGLTFVRGAVREHRLLSGERWASGGGDRVEVRNPAVRQEVLAAFLAASADDVAAAVAAARAAQPGWARTDVAERVAVLRRAADGIGRRAGELGALLCLEVGKNRLEAMGEVDEAVELIRYYSDGAAEGFDIPLATDVPGHRNVSVLRPFGVFGLIGPFNFPLALVLGPSVAALLGGNTIVAKPSPTTSGIAVALAEVLLEAGLPPGTFNLVLGGDDVGRALVAAPGLDGLVFTGSYAVGQSIARRFLGDAGYGRPCIVEMGGKNPAIVSRSADLAVAASGILRSAFGLSGQKCSACSRVLVHRDLHDDLLSLLVDGAHEWHVADPVDPTCRLGPVHTEAAFTRFGEATAMAARDGEIAFGGATLRHLGDGWFVQPTIVADLPHGHHLLREEQFVPLLAVERVDSLADALGRANDQVYGLTAGFFGDDDAEIDAFLDGIEAGTVFVNRGVGATSGGWPGQQSYVGWKGSGSTSRGALGPRYVGQFLREQGRNIVGRR